MLILTSAEVAVAVALAAVVIVFCFVYLRRRRIASGGPLMVCAFRTPAEPRWRLGLLRLSGDQLDWFSVVGPSMRPALSWPRDELDLSAPAPVEEVIPGLPDPVHVSGTAAGAALDLAMPPSASTALRAWLESSPPGHNVNVA
ncbi:putative secreted protein [Nostocoides japonicum T1-X7]|uniref:Putative secreted protein n=1 Tax=Nostocoides japonicum T1-X7 TaxID=1194083 RepID=A0A077LW64_9MICO|nr:DUF2550 family protein [Tetrasphaera japonica]CCH76229.1 putative secreted protein [Tetrasphaera japonica T1-X7]